MTLFFLGIILLIAGYMTYGRFIEKMIAPDDRPTPAITKFDGVDYICLPHWKNMLIQLLNIAGVGPVIGVILGIKFGTIVFVVIPIGNVIAGATHDFLAGMMSVRNGGANLPALVKMNLGRRFYGIFSVFMSLLLLLVVAVFVNIPSQIIDSMKPDAPIFWYAAGGIFLYYICSTIFPIDKIIGKIYPIFGGLLLLGTLAMFVAIVAYAMREPWILTESEGFKAKMFTEANGHPVIPLLFVTIACGIISGFHATQSPIIARTMRSERQGRSSFLLRNDDCRGGNRDDMGGGGACHLQSLPRKNGYECKLGAGGHNEIFSRRVGRYDNATWGRSAGDYFGRYGYAQPAYEHCGNRELSAEKTFLPRSFVHSDYRYGFDSAGVVERRQGVFRDFVELLCVGQSSARGGDARGVGGLAL